MLQDLSVPVLKYILLDWIQTDALTVEELPVGSKCVDSVDGCVNRKERHFRSGRVWVAHDEERSFDGVSLEADDNRSRQPSSHVMQYDSENLRSAQRNSRCTDKWHKGFFKDIDVRKRAFRDGDSVETNTASPIVYNDKQMLRRGFQLLSVAPINEARDVTELIEIDNIDEYTPFLKWHPLYFTTTKIVSPVFLSLVSMVRDGYPFDEKLTTKASKFLSSISRKFYLLFNYDDFLMSIRQDSPDPAAVDCSESNQLALVSSALLPRILSTTSLRDLNTVPSVSTDPHTDPQKLDASIH
ncbi:hypothetical protein BLNAU_16237 [Blattamonas nauphoetae]|uniref:Uncharacterized protein n=1 Tax=Blattamonas nauphoetae TaxID=2049346 RepID=A0ABQ9XDE8_9EUKA|nr:hypothetical protein BLNAU_16237 [Blattamonas nauphoetae]